MTRKLIQPTAIATGAVVVVLFLIAASRAEDSLAVCLKDNLPRINTTLPLSAVRLDGTRLHGFLVSADLKQARFTLRDTSGVGATATTVTIDELERVSFHVQGKVRNSVWAPVGLAGGVLLGALIGSKADSDTGGSSGTAIGAVAFGGLGFIIGLAAGSSETDQLIECHR